jgi:colanic acid biosynthesis protein WcaH
MNIKEALTFLEQEVPTPWMGLPEELFLYISRSTPLVNVDLLVKDETGRTLLSWRDDIFAGKGWHVPGGIIRFKEKLETRIQKVAQTELGLSSIVFDPIPLALNQIIHPERAIRGHFISLLYTCFLNSSFVPSNGDLTEEDSGYLMWHDGCPDNLLGVHEIYRKYI